MEMVGSTFWFTVKMEKDLSDGSTEAEFDGSLRLAGRFARGAERGDGQIGKQQPERYDLMYKLGIVYMKAGDLRNAQTQFLKVDEQTENNIDAKLHLARIYYHQKRVYLADDMINQILRIDPQNEKALELRKKNM